MFISQQKLILTCRQKMDCLCPCVLAETSCGIWIIYVRVLLPMLLPVLKAGCRAMLCHCQCLNRRGASICQCLKRRGRCRTMLQMDLMCFRMCQTLLQLFQHPGLTQFILWHILLLRPMMMLLDKSLAQFRYNRYLLVLFANMLLFCTVRIIVVLAIRLISDFWLRSVQNLKWSRVFPVR